MQQQPPKYVSAMDIAWDLRVTERTVRSWMREGLLPVVRCGPRCVRVRREDYERFVHSRTLDAVV